MTTRTRVALALGSGGARGYAHIGAVEVLEERGYEIVAVAGSSMGALVGGLHAAGRLGAYTAWARSLTQRDVLRLLDPSLRSPGAIQGDKLLARVSELLGPLEIEDLPIPFTAVATDLVARKEVWFQHGAVASAIRASIAMPGVFAPVMINGRLLADGGLMNPVPMTAITASPADLTVAVSLGGERRGELGRGPVQESASGRPVEEWLDRLRRTVAHARENDLTTVPVTDVAPVADAVPGPDVVRVAEALPRGLRTLEVMNLSMDATQSILTRYRLAGYPPDVMMTVPKDACKTMDFHKADEMIALGRELMTAALDRAEAAGAPI